MTSQAEKLVEVMGVDLETAEELMRKHNNNFEKALDSLLNPNPTPTATTPLYATGSNASADSIPPLMPVVDEMDQGQDRELRRAVEMSLDGTNMHQPQPQQYYNNPQNWAMVTTNHNPTPPQDDSLDQAVAQSLVDINQHQDLPLPTNLAIREDRRPVALWPADREDMPMALLLQSLFYVPQVRAAVSKLPTPSDPRSPLYKLQQLFTSMDITTVSLLTDDDDTFSCFPKRQTYGDSHGELSFRTEGFMFDLGKIIETAVWESTQTHPRLFTFGHRVMQCKPPDSSPEVKETNDPIGCLVKLLRKSTDKSKTDPFIHPNSLSFSLSDQLTRFYDEEPMPFVTHDVIYEQSDVLAFLIVQSEDDQMTDPFTFPNHFYLDQYLQENIDAKVKARSELGQMITHLRTATNYQAGLEPFKKRTGLPSLHSAHHYFDKVTERDSTPLAQRRQELANRLKTILDLVQRNISATDSKIAELQSQMANVFNRPEWQKHRYDLRGVLVHTGFSGRKALYSYVQDERQRWWKTVGHDVTEVSELEVLEDSTGSAYAAGPYLLMYSKALPADYKPEPIQWPQVFLPKPEERKPAQRDRDVRPSTPEFTTETSKSKGGHPKSRQC
ncbi:hypothetical protein DL96DRAFT_1679666 [Flagelloscypha sp. PMI_526]|nr:hypothetical protein DL96DRAFT_1679666 [Flagelloscypha sp. PMI_526]